MDGLEGRALSLRLRRTFGVCVVGVGRVSCVASSRVVSLGVVEAFTVVSVQGSLSCVEYEFETGILG